MPCPALAYPRLASLRFRALRRQQPKLLGTVENALGLREFCKEKGWDLVVTADKEGPDSAFAKEIETAE